MVRTGLIGFLLASLVACSSATPPSATSAEPSMEPVSPEPTPAAATATPEPSAQQSSAKPLAAVDLVIATSDLPATVPSAQTIDREITPDFAGNFFGAEYRAALEERGFKLGHQRNFDIGANLASFSFVFEDAEGARAHQAAEAADLVAADCTDETTITATIGEATSALICPAVPGISDGRGFLLVATSTGMIELSIGPRPGEEQPDVDLLIEIARNIVERIAA